MAAAESIGHKRVFALNASSPLTPVQLTVLAAVGGAAIRSMTVFAAAGCGLPPAPPAPPSQLVKDYEYDCAAVSTLAEASVTVRKRTVWVSFARRVCSARCSRRSGISPTH